MHEIIINQNVQYVWIIFCFYLMKSDLTALLDVIAQLLLLLITFDPVMKGGASFTST